MKAIKLKRRICVWDVTYKIQNRSIPEYSKAKKIVRVPNMFGVNGLPWLVRANGHNEPEGWIDLCKVTVTKKYLTFEFLKRKYWEDSLLNTLRNITYRYDSIGWECLEIEQRMLH